MSKNKKLTWQEEVQANSKKHQPKAVNTKISQEIIDEINRIALESHENFASFIDDEETSK